MEPLWSPVVATGGNQWQIDRLSEPQKQAKSVATGCHRLRREVHGKEGVSGSSPEEGSAKAPQKRGFFRRLHLHNSQFAVGMEPLWSLQIEQAFVTCVGRAPWRMCASRLVVISSSTES
jgi:hypothetical protein